MSTMGAQFLKHREIERADARRRHQDAIDTPLLERADGAQLAVGIAVAGGQDDGVLSRNGELLDAADHLADERVGNAGDHHPEGVGAPRDEAASDGADGVALLGGDLLDEFAGLGVHQRAVAQGARNGGMGDVRGSGDILDGNHCLEMTCSE